MMISPSITAPVSANQSFDPALKKLWGFLDRDPMEMHPEEAANTLQYHERLSRMRTPNPFDGETTEARSCFMLRYYAGKREIFSADTGTQTLRPLSFLAYYKGRRELYPNLEIGTPR
jgi:hypothetical protein